MSKNPHGEIAVQTPTISTSPAYSQYDKIGGVLQFSISGDTGQLLQSGFPLELTIIDLDKKNAAITLFYFDKLPSTSVPNDNAACNISAADGANCIGYETIAATDYKNAGDGSSTWSVASHKIAGGVKRCVDSANVVYAIAMLDQSTTVQWTGIHNLIFKLGWALD